LQRPARCVQQASARDGGDRPAGRAARLAGQGAVQRHRAGDLEVHRLPGPRAVGRAAIHPGRALRGGPRRWCQHVAAVALHHGAGHAADDGVADRALRDRLTARVRPVLRPHPRRPGQQHRDRRARPVQQGLPVVPIGQRGRRGRRHPGRPGPRQRDPAAAVAGTGEVMSTPLIRRRRPFSAGRVARTSLFHGGSIVLAVAFLFPIIWAALNSVKTKDEANAQPPTWLPHSLSLQNYRSLSGFDQGIGTYLLNTIMLCVLTVLLSVVVCLLGGYGFARYTFRGKSLLFGATLGILMVPYATILLPLYIVIGRLGLQNTLIGLALVLVMFQLPFGIFLMRN